MIYFLMAVLMIASAVPAIMVVRDFNVDVLAIDAWLRIFELVMQGSDAIPQWLTVSMAWIVVAPLLALVLVVVGLVGGGDEYDPSGELRIDAPEAGRRVDADVAKAARREQEEIARAQRAERKAEQRARRRERAEARAEAAEARPRLGEKARGVLAGAGGGIRGVGAFGKGLGGRVRASGARKRVSQLAEDTREMFSGEGAESTKGGRGGRSGDKAVRREGRQEANSMFDKLRGLFEKRGRDEIVMPDPAAEEADTGFDADRPNLGEELLSWYVVWSKHRDGERTQSMMEAAQDLWARLEPDEEARAKILDDFGMRGFSAMNTLKAAAKGVEDGASSGRVKAAAEPMRQPDADELKEGDREQGDGGVRAGFELEGYGPIEPGGASAEEGGGYEAEDEFDAFEEARGAPKLGDGDDILGAFGEGGEGDAHQEGLIEEAAAAFGGEEDAGWNDEPDGAGARALDDDADAEGGGAFGQWDGYEGSEDDLVQVINDIDDQESEEHESASADGRDDTGDDDFPEEVFTVNHGVDAAAETERDQAEAERGQASVEKDPVEDEPWDDVEPDREAEGDDEPEGALELDEDEIYDDARAPGGAGVPEEDIERAIEGMGREGLLSAVGEGAGSPRGMQRKLSETGLGGLRNPSPFVPALWEQLERMVEYQMKAYAWERFGDAPPEEFDTEEKRQAHLMTSASAIVRLREQLPQATVEEVLERKKGTEHAKWLEGRADAIVQSLIRDKTGGEAKAILGANDGEKGGAAGFVEYEYRDAWSVMSPIVKGYREAAAAAGVKSYKTAQTNPGGAGAEIDDEYDTIDFIVGDMRAKVGPGGARPCLIGIAFAIVPAGAWRVEQETPEGPWGERFVLVDEGNGGGRKVRLRDRSLRIFEAWIGHRGIDAVKVCHLLLEEGARIDGASDGDEARKAVQASFGDRAGVEVRTAVWSPEEWADHVAPLVAP